MVKGGKRMVNVRDVAKWFLTKESMTHKKVQKLCYYAQAWYCTLYDGTPLFDDEIQAWVHGPVIPSLYPVYADYRWTLIPRNRGEAPEFSEEVVSVLDAVYNTYGPLSGDQLESLTHSEQPWIDAREGRAAWESCVTPILPGAMREYYGRKYRQAQND